MSLSTDTGTAIFLSLKIQNFYVPKILQFVFKQQFKILISPKIPEFYSKQNL